MRWGIYFKEEKNIAKLPALRENFSLSSQRSASQLFTAGSQPLGNSMEGEFCAYIWILRWEVEDDNNHFSLFPRDFFCSKDAGHVMTGLGKLASVVSLSSIQPPYIIRASARPSLAYLPACHSTFHSLRIERIG